MNMQQAYKLATEWANWFQCSFFVVQIGPDLYGVASRVTSFDNVVAEFGAQRAA
jgi:hypothetical protein